MAYRFDILTLFPGLFDAARGEGLLGKAIETGLVDVHTHNFRDWTHDRHRTVDDVPYGGGAGMVLKPDPVVACLREVRAQAPGSRVVLLSPAGRVFRQADAARWRALPGLVLLCGRYEGFDARVERHVDEVVSIGDYVLNGGEVAALAIVEAVARLLPGVLGNAASLQEESHTAGLLEGPQYTRPRVFEGEVVPQVLLGGHHVEIARWRRRQALLRTQLRRPELLLDAHIDPSDRAWLADQLAAEPRSEPVYRAPEGGAEVGLPEKGVDISAKLPIFAALVHHPVRDRTGQVVTTALTNVDVHDLARSARTFGLRGVFIVTPVLLQQRMVAEIVGHWTQGDGSTHLRRAEAMRLVRVAADLAEVKETIARTTGRAPVVAVTAAQAAGDRPTPVSTFAAFRRALECGAKAQAPAAPVLMVFGTGWGLAPSVLDAADLRLEPIAADGGLFEATGPEDRAAYNHLSVRAAAAIAFDRLFGAHDG
ncbi:MAG: tRNA (guanosine(37)-N1)-methyltransferase TrmD [Deltaproteobacteria bacterium]|nr:tRNA (guanosine(37)-N1)-methyltransferase TrmD [Deltaproteobacteria bacterium]